MSALKLVSCSRSFGGYQKVYSHESKELKCPMKFSIYLPPDAENKKVPVLYWLSGLTCTEENFIQKSGAQKYAAQHGLAIVGPDTSPRGCGIEGEDDSWDFGSGAGFYLDATQPKWKDNYRMFSYVTQELPALVKESFPVSSDRHSIFGHSMGGHGALTIALKCPGQYRSVSAFAPICNPTHCPWGEKAFAGYLGVENKSHWEDYDATCLVAKYQGPPMEILIDQGKDDGFLKDGQLLPEKFVSACRDNRMPLIYRLQEGYDHSYFFIASFIEEHIAHHAKRLHAD